MFKLVLLRFRSESDVRGCQVPTFPVQTVEREACRRLKLFRSPRGSFVFEALRGAVQQSASGPFFTQSHGKQ